MRRDDVVIGKSYHTTISGSKKTVLVLAWEPGKGFNCQTPSLNVVLRSAAALHEIPVSLNKVKRQGPPEALNILERMGAEFLGTGYEDTGKTRRQG